MNEKPENQTFLDRIIEKIGEYLSLIFLFIVIISFFEILMRYLFNSPTSWVHETASFLGGCLFVFGGAYAISIDKHVRVVLLYDNVSAKTKTYLNLFHHIVGMAFSVMMVWASYLMVMDSWFAPWGELRLQTSGSAWNPAFPAYLKGIIFLTMIILSIQFFLKLILEIRILIEGRHV